MKRGCQSGAATGGVVWCGEGRSRGGAGGGGGDVGIDLLREGEFEAVPGAVGTRRSAAAVKLPEEQREREVVRHPDERTGLEEVGRRIRLRGSMDEVVDQPG